jgi:hypothetical protein
METIRITIICLVLSPLAYRLLMPFIAWIVPKAAMNNAANYIGRTEKKYSFNGVIKSIMEFLKGDRAKKNAKE